MHLRALELVSSVKTEASMESEKASFGGPDWREPESQSASVGLLPMNPEGETSLGTY